MFWIIQVETYCKMHKKFLLAIIKPLKNVIIKVFRNC